MSVRFSINFKRPTRRKLSTNFSNEKDLFFKGDNGCCIILVHGVTGTPYEMSFLARFLNNKGYSVVCPRLANHGGPIEILKNSKWQDWYQSVRKIFMDIVSANDMGIVFAAGLSIGALLALLLADEFQGKISGVSCLAPTVFYDGWNMPWSRHLLPIVYLTPLKNWFYFKEDPPYGIKNKALQKRVHEYYNNARLEDTGNAMQYGYPYIPVSLLYQHHVLMKYLKKRLTYINVPVQLIQAKDDDMASTKNSQFIHDRIKSEIKETVLLYNSYHVITADQERETVAQEMDRFFTRIRSNLKK